MAQGTRGRWIRAATTGLGVMVCTGLIGCMNSDKPKDTKLAKQPAAGLPGTPTLPPGGAASRPGQFGGSQFTGSGANIQPTGGFGTVGAGAPGRVGTNGLNTNTSTVGQSQNWNQQNWPAQPGNPGTIGTPAQPGAFPSVQPAGGVGAAPYAPYPNAGGVASAGYTPAPSPPAPVLTDNLLPPPPPNIGSPGGSEFAGTAPVLPPAPIAPLGPPPTAPGSSPTFPGKGTY